MNFDEWFRWPTKSTDPGVNFVVIVMLSFLAMVAIVVGAVIVVPVLAVIGIAKLIHAHANRPKPTDQLHAETAQRVIAANFPADDDFIDSHARRLIESMGDNPPAFAIAQVMTNISGTLYRAEALNNPLPPLPPAGTIEEGRYRDRLIAFQKKSADAPKTLETFNTTLGGVYACFIDALPPVARTTLQQFRRADDVDAFATFPLVDVLPDVAAIVFGLITPFFADSVTDPDLFAGLRRQLDHNFHEASGFPYPAPTGKLITPDKHKGTPQEIVTAYLHDTPLEELFYAPIPFAFSDAQRFEHTHVVGGSGHGKTQLLQDLILRDLRREGPPALIVIDSQGDMLRKIEHLDLFAGKLADRLIVIDPEDVEHPPALNMFDTANARLAGYSAVHREQIEAGVVEL